MTFKKVVFYIVLLLIVIIVAYSVINKTPATTVLPTPEVVTPVVTSTANYSCSAGNTIAASYTDSSVALTLSDGRHFDLPQTVSASGTRYEKDTIVFVTKGAQALLQENGKTTIDNCLTGNTTAVNGIKTFTDQGKTFTFTYPEAFTLVGGEIGYTENWKVNTDTTLGLMLATVHSPENYQPGTNFGDSTFTVGTSSDPKAVKGCLADTSGQGVIKSTAVINGVPYTKFVSVDAGAGNRYETTSYRAVQNSQCYAIEYTVHYGVLENYPDTVKAFDTKKVHADLESIAQSFKFLPQ